MLANRNFFSFILLIAGLVFAFPAKAICPVCTVAVGAGVGLTRYLGIDDIISGLWVGGLTVSMIMWTVSFMDSKNIRYRGRKISVTLGFYLLIVAPLYWTGVMGHPMNTFLGMDRLLFGIILGSLLFFFGGMFHFYLKRKNQNKVYFPFQKVVLAVFPLIIASLVFYFFTK